MFPQTRYQPAPDRSPGYSQTETVNGHRTFWVMGKDQPTLAMEYGNDKWVEITAKDSEADLQSRVLHIAESITLAPTPVQVPFTVARKVGFDYSANLLMIQSATAGGPTVVKLSYEPKFRTPQVTITATQSPATGEPNGTVGGHSAIVTQDEIILRDVGGFSVKVHRDTPGEDFGADTLRELAGSIELVPEVANREKWTADPVR
jgi:hypothetical protein